MIATRRRSASTNATAVMVSVSPATRITPSATSWLTTRPPITAATATGGRQRAGRRPGAMVSVVGGSAWVVIASTSYPAAVP
jgi:hypothetical protein